jgi:hypothetical protein
MGSIKKACSFKTRVKNTGKECDTSMLAPAMLIAIKRGYKFTETDMLNPVNWLTGLVHSRKAFPLFGQQAPIRGLNNNSEQDVMVTLDDGSKEFVRYGMYNRTIETTAGGLCYAQALQSLNKSGYDIIEVDQTGQMLCRKNLDSTFSGLITDFMYSPSPILADLKNTVYKNRFEYSYNPLELVNNGVIFEGAEQLLSMTGLIDSVVKTGTQVNTITNIFFKVETECASTDLVEAFPTKIFNPSNFIVKDKATGAIVPISSGAVVNGEVKLTGVFTTGSTYTVTGSLPSIWLTNLIEGYDANTENVLADVVIP